MRKMLFIACLILCWITASQAQEESYKIEGRLGQPINTQILLLAETDKGVIELNETTITNGNFEFTGRMPEVTVVYLASQKKDILTTIMLENKNYSITAGAMGLIVEGGGEEQNIWKEFNDLDMYMLQTLQQLQTQLSSATNPMQATAIQQEINNLLLKVQTEELALLKKYNNTLAAACAVASKLENIDENNLMERYNMLGEKAKTSPCGKKITALVEKMQKIAVGAIAPDFSAPLSDGGMLSLYETKAKVKIVDFWASWCVPCRQENVNLLKIYKRFRPKGLEIISFSLDNNKHAWLAAIGQDGSNWKNVSDLKGGEASQVAQEYCVNAIPYTLVLDEENRIVAKNIRGKELEKKIEEMLKKKKD